MIDEDNEIVAKKPLKFTIKDYIHMANNATMDAFKSICTHIENEQVIFILKNKFHIIGDTSDSAKIAEMTNKKFNLEGDDAFDAKKVDKFIKLIIEDAENGEFGGAVCSKIGLAKGLMIYCNKHKGEFNENG